MTALDERPGTPSGLARGREGRWLGGVCVGLRPVSGLAVGWVRVGFAAAALVGGLGIALYLACWLIVPVEGDDGAREGPREAVAIARACAACAGLAVLAVVGALAAAFGFGWIAVGLGAAVLIAVLTGWSRLGPAWALLPVAALTLPAIAIAGSGLRLAPQLGPAIVAPRTAAAIGSTVYRSGLGTMLVDLRRTRLPATGAVTLRIDAGLRRTIVALPENRCVRVAVDYRADPFAARLAALLSGRTPSFTGLVLFGRMYLIDSEESAAPATRPGPLLRIEFHSQGGSLYVRDYPTTIDPRTHPYWPGFRVQVEPRPDTRRMPRRAARALLRHWRVRRAAQLANARAVGALVGGPCDPAAPAHTAIRRAPR